MFAIVFKDDEKEAYWTTRCCDTDNYTYDELGATLFAETCFANALIKTLGLDDHYVVEIPA